MSRRSAVATDAGTTCATLALAEAGLGSLPPQLERYATSNRTSPSEVLGWKRNGRRTGLTDGCRRRLKAGASDVACGLRGAIVIRRPRSEEECDKSNINCSRAGLNAQGLDVKSQPGLRNIAARTEGNIAGYCSCKINFILKQKKHLRSLQKITFIDSFFTWQLRSPSNLGWDLLARACRASRVYCSDFLRTH